MTEIKNDNLNITTKDVQMCTDRNILLNWLSEIETDMQVCKMQLQDAKADRYINGVYADIEWFNKAEKFVRIQGIFLKQIQNRLTVIKRDDEIERLKSLKNKFQNERDFWKEKLKNKCPRYFKKCIKEYEKKFEN